MLPNIDDLFIFFAIFHKVLPLKIRKDAWIDNVKCRLFLVTSRIKLLICKVENHQASLETIKGSSLIDPI